jgi:hypothetical protein
MRNQNKLLSLAAIGLVAVTSVLIVARPGKTQQAAPKLTVGLYAPTVDFGSNQQRLQYVQGLAKAIESQTGSKTTAQSFSSLSALKKANVDFAIVDGQCYATSVSSWKLLADAEVGGGTSRNWALYSSLGSDMQGLRGKKLAFVTTGCKDDPFIDNAMLDSEVDDKFFSARVGKPDIAAAVAEVASYKGAQAVFAPVGSAKGLTKVFETGNVPNPAFVQVNNKLTAQIVKDVQTAVTGFGGGGAIDNWTSASKTPYTSLSGRMGKVVKRGVFASPEPVRFDAKDVLVDPTTLDNTALTEVQQHFEQPPARME